MINFPSLTDLQNAIARTRDYIHQTPVMTSTGLNEIAGMSLFFKCENFQRMGAFKMRGAVNAILQIPDDERKKGVITHSSGNFAQALSLAARQVGVNATIVMPVTATESKRAAVRAYGGKIVDCGPSQQEREQTCAEIMAQTGAIFIHPSNDMRVILGNATAIAEFAEQVPNLDALICPVGGGGLLAGVALAASYLCPQTQVFAGEPAQADDAKRSLEAGKILPSENPTTIADGLKTSLGDQNFPIIQKCVKDIFTVEETEIMEAMRLIWERMKIIVEPSSAVAFAAALAQKSRFSGKRVGIVLSGGNVDLKRLPF